MQAGLRDSSSVLEVFYVVFVELSLAVVYVFLDLL
jgi:hypothetical protein